MATNAEVFTKVFTKIFPQGVTYSRKVNGVETPVATLSVAALVGHPAVLEYIIAYGVKQSTSDAHSQALESACPESVFADIDMCDGKDSSGALLDPAGNAAAKKAVIAARKAWGQANPELVEAERVALANAHIAALNAGDVPQGRGGNAGLAPFMYDAAVALVTSGAFDSDKTSAEAKAFASSVRTVATATGDSPTVKARAAGWEGLATICPANVLEALTTNATRAQESHNAALAEAARIKAAADAARIALADSLTASGVTF